MKWTWSCLYVALAVLVAAPAWGGVCLYDAPGDMDMDGATEADDVQCSILVSLWALGIGVPEDEPECAAWGHAGTDINCDSSHTMVDTAVATAAALGLELPAEIDANGDGCPDACETVEDPAQSCLDNCGGIALGGCWCDSICASFGDCCEDACLVCGSCPEEPAECGDGVCAPSESCETCVEDCGACPFCGDGECNAFENCYTCGEDCGECEPGGDCCDASANTGPGCSDEACVDAICPLDSFCCSASWDFLCADQATELCETCGGTPPVCGDAICSPTETCETCSDDCGVCPTCGDGECNGFENCFSCEEDCGTCPFCGDGACDDTENCFSCPGDCTECPAAGNCCEANGGIGCEDTACTELVCAVDAFCCNSAWDSICADQATEFCEGCGGSAPTCGDGECSFPENCDLCPEDCGSCAVCGDGECNGSESCWFCPEDCGECPICGDGECNGFENCFTCESDCGECLTDGPCCDPTAPLEYKGCEDEACSATVCTVQSYCCDIVWDSLCSQYAQELCATCGGTPPVCGDGACTETESCDTCSEDCGACPACGDGVCNGSEQCWSCLEDCGECPTAGSCCEADPTGVALGCEDAACTEIVCAADSFCCNTFWDGICANTALTECAVCTDEAPECGDGVCEGLESCTSCAADCGECPFCGDGTCDITEACWTCGEDCGECPPGGNCCEEAIDGISTGCEDEACSDLICAADPFCCTTYWDGICASAALTQCEVCTEDAPECGDGVCEGLESCTTCAADCGDCPFCGDGTCDLTEACFTCGEDCGECPPGGDCCAEAPDGLTTGCEDAACTDLICAADPFCCSTYWDGICASAAQTQCAVCL